MANIIVIALGGNALDPVSQKTKENVIKNNRDSLDNFCRSISKLVKNGKKIIITHGNGPQVGNLFLQQELSKEYVNPLTLNICVALSQGQIGTILEQKLTDAFKRLKIKKNIIPVLTHVLVNPEDTAFQNPTKPIGPAYTELEAKKMEKPGITIKQTPEGLYRRVVASPQPQKIMEINIIKNLLEDNILVIAAGGGGIPITIKNKKIQRIDAVIDKDLASEVLAKEIKAEKLLILTNVDYISLNYRKPNEEKIKKISMAEAEKYLKQGQFPAGSMGPKVKAAIDFLKSGGKKVIIGHLDNIGKILQEKSGTIITK